MRIEIERKFLVIGDEWRNGAKSVAIRQGYLNSNKDRTVRVRILGNKGFLTVKGIGVGIVRPEFEYEIPFEDAQAMLDGLVEKPFLEKTRYIVLVDGIIWEIDEFEGDNLGLVVAEVELDSPDRVVSLPI